LSGGAYFQKLTIAKAVIKEKRGKSLTSGAHKEVKKIRLGGGKRQGDRPLIRKGLEIKRRGPRSMQEAAKSPRCESREKKSDHLQRGRTNEKSKEARKKKRVVCEKLVEWERSCTG